MILSFVGPAVKSKWGLASGEESMLTTVVFIGMLFGASTWGLFSDNFGRKMSMLGLVVVTCVAGLPSAFSPNYASMVICRCLVGFGLVRGHVFLSCFLEFVHVSYRGAWMVVFSAYWSAGTIFEASLAWVVMTKLNWRWLLALSAVPPFALLLFYCLAPQSPRYLLAKGKTIDADKTRERIVFINRTKVPPGKLVADRDTRHSEEATPSRDTHPLSTTMKITRKLQSGFSSVFYNFLKKTISDNSSTMGVILCKCFLILWCCPIDL